MRSATSWSPPSSIATAASAAFQRRSSGSSITYQATSPSIPDPSPVISAWNRGPHPSRAPNPTEWPRRSCARSNATTFASARDRTPKASSASCLAGSTTTTRFTRTKRSVIVPRESSSELAQTHDRVRSFGGNNTFIERKLVEEPADGVPERVFGSCRGFAEQRLQLGEELLDRVQVWRVGRQVQEACADRPDRPRG